MATKEAPTYDEQVTAYESKRAAEVARAEAVMAEAAEEGATLTAEQQAVYDEAVENVKIIDGHLSRLKTMQELVAKAAKPVRGDTPQEAAASRQGRIEVRGPNAPKGLGFARYAMALAAGKGNMLQAAEIAKKWNSSHPEIEAVFKAAVAAGTTTDPTWAKPLVEYQTLVGEFAELLRPATIVGRIPGLVSVPFNIRIPRQTGGATAQWVGEGAPKPVSALSFDDITLGLAKVSGIVVITDELARSSNPNAETYVLQDLSNTLVQLWDRDFVDPAKAAVANVSPASVTNGVTPVTASGPTADNFNADARAIISQFLTQNMSLNGAVWIMSETALLSIQMLFTPLGQPAFPTASGAQPTLYGLPVIASQNVPDTGGGNTIILAKANEILLAFDGQVMLDASDQASLQMDTAPDNPPSASTVFVSLWQTNRIGLRAEAYVNWTKRRPGAVRYITGANYGDVPPAP